jgi:hypothetical protein
LEGEFKRGEVPLIHNIPPIIIGEIKGVRFAPTLSTRLVLDR